MERQMINASNPFMVGSLAFRVYQYHIYGMSNQEIIASLEPDEIEQLITELQSYYDEVIVNVLQDFRNLISPLIDFSETQLCEKYQMESNESNEN